MAFNTASDLNDLVLYYGAYLGACAALIGWLSWVLHRTGRIFLADAFAGNVQLVQAIGRLLDIGFYLVSLGYVALTYDTRWPLRDASTSLRIAILKLGGLMLILGVAHIFNLLLLALFRQRRVTAAAPNEA